MQLSRVIEKWFIFLKKPGSKKSYKDVEMCNNLSLLRMRTAQGTLSSANEACLHVFRSFCFQLLFQNVRSGFCSQPCLALTSALLVPDHQQGEKPTTQNLDLVCFCPGEVMGNECLCRWRLRLPPGRRRWLTSVAQASAARVGSNWMMFWHLLSDPIIRGQAYRFPPMSTAEWEDKRILLDEKT